MTARYLTYTDAADYLGVPVSSLRKMVELGEIPHIKLGRRVRFDKQDLDLHMRRHRIGASA